MNRKGYHLPTALWSERAGVARRSDNLMALHAEVDAGWRRFWWRRGRTTPPVVSGKILVGNLAMWTERPECERGLELFDNAAAKRRREQTKLEEELIA